jgi:Nucleotidyl transferase AbiEii toxin, Type IV TA system
MALKHAWEVLRPEGLPMALMGGLALAVWNHPRATRDVDLLVAVGDTDLSVMLATLARAQILPKRQPPVLTLGPSRVVQLLYEPAGAFTDVQIDLLLADSPYHQTAVSRRVSARLPSLDLEISVLSCEDLILHKLLAGRILDRADAAALLRANREEIDLNYLADWVNRLALSEDFGEVWGEAFPGESWSLPGA